MLIGVDTHMGLGYVGVVYGGNQGCGLIAGWKTTGVHGQRRTVGAFPPPQTGHCQPLPANAFVVLSFTLRELGSNQRCLGQSQASCH